MGHAATARPLGFRQWLDRLPKVELHVHLEGAIPYDSPWDLICKYGGDPDASDPAALRAWLQYRDFPHFIEIWHWKNRFLREYEDFTFIAEVIARDFANQNIRYVEASFSPRDFDPARARADRHRCGAPRRAGASSRSRGGVDR